MVRQRDALTKDLFSWEPPKVSVAYSEDVIGRGPLENRIARLIGQALRDVRDDGVSRKDVAARMADFLGRPLSETMLNKWSSEGSEDHRIPFDAFIALIRATGARELISFVAGEFGLTVIEDRYVELIEAQLLDDHMAEMEARRATLAAKRKARR